MSHDQLYALAARAVLGVHLAIVAFNLFGLIAVPLGALAGWRFVRILWWRALHLLSMAVVAAQALFGRACFLTLWQAALAEQAGESAARGPLIERWIEAVMFWPLPLWVFAAAYSAAFALSVALWRLVPPMKKVRAASARA